MNHSEIFVYRLALLLRFLRQLVFELTLVLQELLDHLVLLVELLILLFNGLVFHIDGPIPLLLLGLDDAQLFILLIKSLLCCAQTQAKHYLVLLSKAI